MRTHSANANLRTDDGPLFLLCSLLTPRLLKEKPSWLAPQWGKEPKLRSSDALPASRFDSDRSAQVPLFILPVCNEFLFWILHGMPPYKSELSYSLFKGYPHFSGIHFAPFWQEMSIKRCLSENFPFFVMLNVFNFAWCLKKSRRRTIALLKPGSWSITGRLPSSRCGGGTGGGY